LRYLPLTWQNHFLLVKKAFDSTITTVSLWVEVFEPLFQGISIYISIRVIHTINYLKLSILGVICLAEFLYTIVVPASKNFFRSLLEQFLHMLKVLSPFLKAFLFGKIIFY
jgi:hypothetical protein